LQHIGTAGLMDTNRVWHWWNLLAEKNDLSNHTYESLTSAHLQLELSLKIIGCSECAVINPARLWDFIYGRDMYQLHYDLSKGVL